MPIDSQYLTTQQVADQLGITRKGVRWLIRQEKLAAEKIGRDYFIRKDKFAQFARKRKATA